VTHHADGIVRAVVQRSQHGFWIIGWSKRNKRPIVTDLNVLVARSAWFGKRQVQDVAFGNKFDSLGLHFAPFPFGPYFTSPMIGGKSSTRSNFMSSNL
jgi:hypothetical protein